MVQLKARNEQHLQSLRRKDAQHRADLERRQRLEWRAHQQKVKISGYKVVLIDCCVQLEELGIANRIITSKNKELSQLTECLLLKQNECDKLEEEVKRLRSVETWRSISPGSSTGDLTSSSAVCHCTYSLCSCEVK